MFVRPLKLGAVIALHTYRRLFPTRLQPCSPAAVHRSEGRRWGSGGGGSPRAAADAFYIILIGERHLSLPDVLCQPQIFLAEQEHPASQSLPQPSAMSRGCDLARPGGLWTLMVVVWLGSFSVTSPSQLFLGLKV